MPALSGTTSWIGKENQTVQGKQQPKIIQQIQSDKPYYKQQLHNRHQYVY